MQDSTQNSTAIAVHLSSHVQDAKQGVRNLLSRGSLLAELQSKGVLNIIPQVLAHPCGR